MYKVIANTDKRVINPCEERKLYRAGIIGADLEKEFIQILWAPKFSEICIFAIHENSM